MFAEKVAELAGVETDAGIYDQVRAFRAPNSRHPKTGLHKRRLSVDELLHLRPDVIRDMATEPAPFDIPKPTCQSDQAADDWQAAVEQLGRQTEANRRRRADSNGSATLNRQTLAFIKDGATAGDRHRLAYSAARNLGEFGCPLELAQELLREAALDSGLSPSDVRRQIECGISDASKGDDA